MLEKTYMPYQTLFIAFVCFVALTTLLISRVFRKSENPKLDTTLAQIVLLAFVALLAAWQINSQ